MKKSLLTLAAALTVGVMSVHGATFDVNFSISGSGFSGSSMTARTLTAIEFTGSYSFSPNSSCADPFTIVRDGETVLSTLASEGKIATEEDDWGDETTAIYFSSSPFNQAGTYTISAPAGFFRTGSGNTSNAKEVVLTLTSPVPSSVTLVVDGTNIAMTAAGDNTFTATGVAVTGAGSVKIQGSTYYGAVNGQSTAITAGEATPIGYNGKNWTVAAGTYDVTVDWNETAPTVTFVKAVPPVQTFDVTPVIQGVSSSTNTASTVRTIDFNAYYSFKANTECTEPMTISRNGQTVYSTLASEGAVKFEEDDWGDETVSLYLNPALNGAGDYTFSMPEGFFTKTGGAVSAAKEVTFKIAWAAPATLSLRGSGLAADVELTKADDSNVYTASGVSIDGQVRLQGSTYFGVVNGQSAAITAGTPAEIGYNGSFWTLASGKYDVTVDWDAATVNFVAKPTVQTFDVTPVIQGVSSSTNTASTVRTIDFNAYYSFKANTECTEPMTISRNGQTVYSTLASEGAVKFEEDDWGDETVSLYLNPALNGAGDYTFSMPEGFFTKTGGAVSAAKEVTFKIAWAAPATLSLRGSGLAADVELTKADDSNVYTASGVSIDGQVRLQGSTYFGVVNGQSAAITAGTPAEIGYNGSFWTLASGKYDVTVDWDAATVNFVAKPTVQTFELGISVQGATDQNTAKEFQRIDLPAKWTVYYLNSSNNEPITVTWGDEEIYSIDRTSSKLLAMDNDDDWEDDAYMINLGERVNRVGVYTITVPEGFFKSGSKVNAAVSQSVTVTSPIPSMLSIRGKVGTGSMDADVDMTLEGSIFTASKVDINDADGSGYGEIQLIGDSWYGCCNNENAYISVDEPTPVGYNGGFWKVAAATYKVTVDWTDGDPYVTFVKDTQSIDGISAESASDAVYYTLQGIRVINPAKGQTLIEVRDGKASKIAY